MFDPCGTRKIEGDEILERIAKELGICSKEELKKALFALVMETK